MEHKKISLALIGAGALATLGGLFLFMVYAPLAAAQRRALMPEAAFLYWPMLCTVWAIGAVYLTAMVFYFRIVVRIGRDQSFCMPNARDMNRIALCMGLAGILWLILCVVPHLANGIPTGPVWIILTLAALASFCVGGLAWGLGQLLKRAVTLKEENDLTI